MNSHIVEVKFDVDNDWVDKTTLLEESMRKFNLIGRGICFMSSPPIRDIEWECSSDEVESATETLFSVGKGWPGFTVHTTELNEELDDE